MILIVLTWIASIVAILLIILSLASGLYYLVELVEEHIVVTQKVMRFTLQFILVLYVLIGLLESSVTWTPILIGLLAHILYALLLNEYPLVSMTSPLFLLSCVMVLVNHFSWFYHFNTRYTPFSQVASVFGILVWFVPFMFFISLSANELTLPNYDANGKPKKGHFIKRALDGLLGRNNAREQIPVPADVNLSDRRASQLLSPMDNVQFMSPMDSQFPNNPLTQRRY